jgi:hypothetical protein
MKNIISIGMKTGAMICILALAGCVSPPSTPYGADGAPISGYSAQEAESISRAYSSRNAAVEFLSNTTIMTAGGGHGTQIEYLAANGTTSLWYPQNTVLVPGRWKVVDDKAGVPIMCFLYGPNTYNPVTREVGGAWECNSTVQSYLMRVFQIASGDPFRLGSGRLPFVMPTEDEAKRAVTFGTAKAIGGLSNVTVRYKLNRFTVE